jgi:tyrosyl-tRNA synthetase
MLNNLLSKKLIKDCTNQDALLQRLESEKITFYFGVDLTADGIHVGHLSGLMLAKRLLDAGHFAIVLLGDGTTKIGDPTGKDKERPIISQEQIEANKKGIKSGIEQILGKDNPSVKFVANAQWLDKLSYIDVLNEVGRHYTLAKMLSLESVKLRLEREQSITFTEFNYSILQGYDFYHLAKHYDCTLQIGGSDQWGNITSGTELARKKLEKEVFGLTIPLLTKSDGSKMGKSEGGAVWVNGEKLSDFAYFQFFRNVDDADIEKMLHTFTLLDNDQITELTNLKGRDVNIAKEVLAFEATKICRGLQPAQKCLEDAKNLFSQQDTLVSTLNLEVKTCELGCKIVEVLINLGFAKSNSEAKNLLAAGAVRMIDDKGDETKINDSSFAFYQKGDFVIKCGKKNIGKIKV